MNRVAYLAVLSLLIAAPVRAEGAPPLPLDPLTPEEARLAEKVASDDARVRKLVGGQGRVIYVRFISVKRDEPGAAPSEPSGRYAEVMFHIDPDRGGVRTLVELGAGRVVEAVSVPEQAVPIGSEDVRQAATIAFADAGVRKLLGDRADAFQPLSGAITEDLAGRDYVEGLRTVGVSPKDPCSKHRCIVLLFTSNDRPYLTGHEITVDLTTKSTTIQPRDRPGAPSHRHEGGPR